MTHRRRRRPGGPPGPRARRSVRPGSAASTTSRCAPCSCRAPAARSRPGSPPRRVPVTPPLPTVVDVHGGPLGAWAPAPHVEVLLLAAHGYRVVLPNIRGSATYGRDWIRPQLGDWGGVDAADVHAAVDHVIELGLADPDRLGVMGLSLRRVHGQLAHRHDRPLPGRGVRERRDQPGIATGRIPTAVPNSSGRR